MSLLNSAWFGVPESTQCWKLEGFKEAIDLLEDPPDFPTCEHGTAMDVHCCHCHSGFIFDANHQCPPKED